MSLPKWLSLLKTSLLMTCLNDIAVNSPLYPYCYRSTLLSSSDHGNWKAEVLRSNLLAVLSAAYNSVVGVISRIGCFSLSNLSHSSYIFSFSRRSSSSSIFLTRRALRCLMNRNTTMATIPATANISDLISILLSPMTRPRLIRPHVRDFEPLLRSRPLGVGPPETL